MRVRSSLVAAFLVAASTVLVTSTPSHADDPDRATGLIIGDSITARYNDTPGDAHRGWWSFLAEEGGWEPVRSAESGSGVIKRGRDCAGTIFRSRTAGAISRLKPDFIIVEGGRNDLGRCLSDGTTVPTTYSEIASAWSTYLASVRALAADAGVPAHRVYVMSPWGQKDTAKAYDVRSRQRSAARAQGFTWISLGMLTSAQTVDGSHPNLSGNEALWHAVSDASDLDTRFHRSDDGGTITGHVVTPSGRSVQTHVRVTAENESEAHEAVTTVGSHGSFALRDLEPGVHGYSLYFPWQDVTATITGLSTTVSDNSSSGVTVRTRIPCSRTFTATRLGDRKVRFSATTSGSGYGVSRPSGSVTVLRHGRAVARLQLTYGSATLTATGQSRGKATYTAKYSGDCWTWSRTATTTVK